MRFDSLHLCVGFGLSVAGKLSAQSAPTLFEIFKFTSDVYLFDLTISKNCPKIIFICSPRITTYIYYCTHHHLVRPQMALQSDSSQALRFPDDCLLACRRPAPHPDRNGAAVTSSAVAVNHCRRVYF